MPKVMKYYFFGFLRRNRRMVKKRCCMYLICYLTIVTCVGCGQSEDTPPTPPNYSILTVVAKPTAVVGDAYSSITATLTSNTGTPIFGYLVNFKITQNESNCILMTVNELTDIKGNATAIYKSGFVKGVDIIQASCENVNPVSIAVYVTPK
jgi:hypothetical protein